MTRKCTRTVAILPRVLMHGHDASLFSEIYQRFLSNWSSPRLRPFNAKLPRYDWLSMRNGSNAVTLLKQLGSCLVSADKISDSTEYRHASLYTMLFELSRSAGSTFRMQSAYSPKRGHSSTPILAQADTTQSRWSVSA